MKEGSRFSRKNVSTLRVATHKQNAYVLKYERKMVKAKKRNSQTIPLKEFVMYCSLPYSGTVEVPLKVN